MDVRTAIATRRSERFYTEPAPDDQELTALLGQATSSPDHGRLRPWRWILLRGQDRAELGRCLAQEGDPGHRERTMDKMLRAPLLAVLVFAPGSGSRVPEWEQLAASCSMANSLMLLLHSHGYGSMWRTGQVTRSDGARVLLSLGPGERVLGAFFIGTADPSRRLPRRRAVDVAGKVSRFSLPEPATAAHGRSRAAGPEPALAPTPTPAPAREQRDSVRLLELLRGHMSTQLVAAAARLRIPDHLGAGARTAAELSERTGTSAPALRRYLRALEELGLVESTGPDEYRNTSMAELLRGEAGGLYGQALLAGGDYYQAWSELDHALRTGTSAFEHRHGTSLWDRFSGTSEVAAAFTRTMRFSTEQDLAEILGLYAFPDQGLVVDVGAGHGTLTAGLLERSPRLHAIAFDQPAVIGHARRTVTERGFGDRCELVEGSFLDSVPKGADLYLLKSVVHDWNDADALRILRNCRAAMGDRSRLLLIERTTAGDPLLAAIRDMTMLVLFGGQDRTAAEYGTLLDRAGFAVRRSVIGTSGICLLEAAARP